MSTNDAAIREHLEKAQAEIDSALLLLDGTEPPEPPSGDVIPVGPTDNLLDKIATAPAGATLAIDPAYVGVLNNWDITKPLTLTTSAPPSGAGRITPEQLPGPILRGFLNITAKDVTLRMVRCEGPHASGTLVTTGPNTKIERCVLLGSPEGQHRGVRADSDTVLIKGSHIANIWKDQDTQAVGGWDGAKHIKVIDCYLEASGENVMYGGSDMATEAGMPDDILIEDCHMFKPLEWRGKAGCTIKNLFELKAARNVIVRRCLMENSWEHGQTGFAVVLTPKNQDGKNPWTVVENVLFEDCQFKHMGSAVQMLGEDYNYPSGKLSNVEFRRCHFSDIDNAKWGGGGRQFQINRGPHGLKVIDCTFDGANLNSCLTFEDSTMKVEGLVMQNTFMPGGKYGIKCSEVAMGIPTLDLYCPGYVWQGMTIAGTEGNGNWPTGTTSVPAGTSPPNRRI